MKILIVKTSALGDVIQCFPVLDFLHRLFPSAAIDWVVEKPFSELLKAHPLIHRVYEVETKKWKRAPLAIQSWKEAYRAFKDLRETPYDLAFDLQGNLKSGLFIGAAKGREKVGLSRACAPEWPNTFFTTKRFDVDRKASITSQYLSLAAAPFPNQKPEGRGLVRLNISEEEEKWIDEQLSGAKGPRLMVCMGSNWENKKLSLATWEAFLKKVEEILSPTLFFVWGDEKEREEAEQLARGRRLLPRMGLPVWQRMMGQMDVVLSVDSGALHLASTTGVRTYSFFGPSSPRVYKPPGEKHGSFQGACPYGISFTKRCPKLRTCSSGACVKSVFSDVLIKNFFDWYKNHLY